MAKARLDPGTVIDGFKLEERLHRGGMADIWRVTKPGLDAPMVLKAPFLDYDSDLSLLVGFEVEQMIMAELSGLHVPRLVAKGEFTVQPYVVMEHLPGESLQRLLKGGPMAIGDAVDVVTRIADALGDLHRQDVIHLDLKPANVMFRETGEAVIIDYGLSRHLHLPDLLEEQFHKPAGTVEYMAPEQLLRVRSDKRSDLFALGAIFYQLVTGELPFGEPGRIAQVQKRVWQEPLPPRSIRQEISPELQEVILKCIEIRPDRRYAAAQELAFDLRHLDIVEKTERSARMTRTDRLTTFRRWMRARTTLAEIAASATKPPPRAPIVLVAVDLMPEMDGWRHALLDAAASALANIPGARLACLNVMLTSLLAIDENVDAEGENIHVRRLGDLRRWAEPLALPRGKATFHLVEAHSVAGGVIDFAKANNVDHLVMGAPHAAGGMSNRQSAQIASEAPCTVTIVRPPAGMQVEVA